MNWLALAITLQPISFDFKHICGTDDRQYTTVYNGAFDVSWPWVQLNAEPVARVGGCSATLIDKDLVITAAHCSIRAGEQIRFNYLWRGDETLYTEITRVMEEDWGLDYSILEIRSYPGLEVRKLTTQKPAIGEEVYVLGHPEGKRQMISAGPLVYAGDLSLGYKADTMGGSSGSGVVNSNGELFAIHQWGSCWDRGGGYNGGTLLSAIAKESDIIKALLPPGD